MSKMKIIGAIIDAWTLMPNSDREEIEDISASIGRNLDALSSAFYTEPIQSTPDDGSCTFCGCVPTLPHDICRACLEERAPKRREIPAGATICKHGTEPYDCRICFPIEQPIHRNDCSARVGGECNCGLSWKVPR